MRVWALKTFKSFGSVDCDEYDELESVIDWLLNVINFNLFVNYVESDDLADDTQNVVLPHHLFTSKPRDFWLGICTILTVMTKSCIQTCLLPSDLSHRELLESVLALLGEDSDKEYDIPNFHTQSESYKCKNTVFWPILQCFIVLVDKLGSRFWMLTTTTPNSVLKLIKNNPYYQLQLNICYSHAAQLDLAKNNDNDLSFSQLVYDDSLDKASKSMEPIQERYHGFSLSWVVPFIKSLIDFGDYESSTVVELLDFVCHIHSISLHGDTNVSSTDLFQTVLPIEVVAERVESLFLPQESLKCITQSVDVLFSQKVYSVLLQCKQAIFCMITVLCSYVLSKGKRLHPVLNQIKQHLSQTARTYTSLVMYCSTEKTASKLWYLVKQISSLSPFLSTVSNQAGCPHGHSDLLQPDELCKILLKLIADKQNNQDIAGPFLYPPSFDSSTLKKTFTSITVIKQEPFEEETNSKLSYSTRINQPSLLNRDMYHHESPTHSEGSDIAKVHYSSSDEKMTDGDTWSALDQKQVSLKLKKLPITVSKSDNGVLHYAFESDSNNSATIPSGSPSKTSTEPIKSHRESDTDSCSSSTDDDNDDLPSYFSFQKRRLTDASTSSTVTIESEFNEQLVMQRATAKEELVKISQPNAPFKQNDDNITLKTDDVIWNTNNINNFASPRSDHCTLKQSSEEHYSELEDSSIKLDTEANVKCNTNAEQEWFACNQQNTDGASVNRSSSVIDMVLTECDPHLSKVSLIEDFAVTDQHGSKIEQHGSTGLELGSMENQNSDSSGDEDVFGAIDNQHTTSLDKQEPLINSHVDMNFKNPEPMQSENEQCADLYTSFTGNDPVVVPIKHHNVKFKSKAMPSETNLGSSNEVIDQDSVKAKPSCVLHLQQPSSVSTQQMNNDKIQPAVAGRAPFSKSRMASLHIPSALNAITKVQAGKAKDIAISKGLHKNTLASMGQSNAATTETSKVVVKVELSRVYSKDEFLMKVLSWDPTAFHQTQERGKSVISEGPYSLPTIAKVPATFKSSDHYIEVFEPLLLLETWDTVSS